MRLKYEPSSEPLQEQVLTHNPQRLDWTLHPKAGRVARVGASPPTVIQHPFDKNSAHPSISYENWFISFFFITLKPRVE